MGSPSLGFLFLVIPLRVLPLQGLCKHIADMLVSDAEDLCYASTLPTEFMELPDLGRFGGKRFHVFGNHQGFRFGALVILLHLCVHCINPLIWLVGITYSRLLESPYYKYHYTLDFV